MSGFSASTYSADYSAVYSPSGRMVEGEITAEERKWATFMHLGGLSGAIWGPLMIIIPLVLWLTKRDESAFLDDHGKEALNFQISIWLWVVISMVLILCLIGIPMLIAIPFFWLVMTIVMAVRSNRGEYVRYPATFRFIK